jgi:hypothetical protein
MAQTFNDFQFTYTTHTIEPISHNEYAVIYDSAYIVDAPRGKYSKLKGHTIPQITISHRLFMENEEGVELTPDDMTVVTEVPPEIEQHAQFLDFDVRYLLKHTTKLDAIECADVLEQVYVDTGGKILHSEQATHMRSITFETEDGDEYN